MWVFSFTWNVNGLLTLFLREFFQVKSTSFEYKYMFPQPVIFKMPTPQCGMFARVLVHHDRRSDAELYFKGTVVNAQLALFKKKYP